MVLNLTAKNERAEKQLQLRHYHRLEWQNQLAVEAQTRRHLEDRHGKEMKQLRAQAFLMC